jgi:hypothetical protein
VLLAREGRAYGPEPLGGAQQAADQSRAVVGLPDGGEAPRVKQEHGSADFPPQAGRCASVRWEFTPSARSRPG